MGHLWRGAGVGLLLAIGIWLIYRAELRKGTSGRLRWFFAKLEMSRFDWDCTNARRPHFTTSKERRGIAAESLFS